MRRLWIQRHKAASGRMAAMNVYMEDPEQGDTEIGGILCRKLGQLKNGQKKRFPVAEESVKIFVVSGNGGKKEQPFVQLEEGRDDIFLSGKVFRGKTFRFDGMEEMSEQQKRNRGKGLGTVILVLVILLGIGGGVFAGWKISDRLLNGTSAAVAAEKTFSVEQLRLTLTDAFAEGTLPGYTACYSSGEVSVYVLREGFDAFEGFGDLSVAGYGTMVLANNGLADSVELTEEGNRAFFDHRYAAGTGEYAYHCVLLKGSDAFWLVQFAVPGEAEEAYAADVDRWAKSISFAD